MFILHSLIASLVQIDTCCKTHAQKQDPNEKNTSFAPYPYNRTHAHARCLHKTPMRGLSRRVRKPNVATVALVLVLKNDLQLAACAIACLGARDHDLHSSSSEVAALASASLNQYTQLTPPELPRCRDRSMCVVAAPMKRLHSRVSAAHYTIHSKLCCLI